MMPLPSPRSGNFFTWFRVDASPEPKSEVALVAEVLNATICKTLEASAVAHSEACAPQLAPVPSPSLPPSLPPSPPLPSLRCGNFFTWFRVLALQVLAVAHFGYVLIL